MISTCLSHQARCLVGVSSARLPKATPPSRPSIVRAFSSVTLNEKVHKASPSQTEAKPTLHHSVPDFNNTRSAFASKTTPELLRAAVCFQLCQIQKLVEHSEELLEYSRKEIGDRATDTVLKATLHGHFCAGENQATIQPVLQQLDQAGVGSILDYVAESDGEPPANKSDTVNPFHAATQRINKKHNIAREYDYKNEAKCDQHVKVFQQCIQDAASLSKDSFAAIKVTALGNPKLLERMSQAIVESKRLFQKFDTNLDGYVTREEFEAAYK